MTQKVNSGFLWHIEYREYTTPLDKEGMILTRYLVTPAENTIRDIPEIFIKVSEEYKLRTEMIGITFIGGCDIWKES
jgi:hypothetical protein